MDSQLTLPAAAGIDAPFRRLLLASFLSAAGDRVHQVALVALIVGVTGSLAEAGLVFVVSTLPYLIFGLVSGAIIACGFAMMGAAVFAVGFTDSLWVATVLAVLSGAGNMLFLIPSITMLQQQAVPDMRGRVIGVRHMLTCTAFMLSNTAAGALADGTGVSILYVVLGAGMVALACVTLGVRITREAT